MKHLKTTNIYTNSSQNNDYNHHLETLDTTELQYLNYLRGKQIKRNKWIN